jgi:hypothetical protein
MTGTLREAAMVNSTERFELACVRNCRIHEGSLSFLSDVLYLITKDCGILKWSSVHEQYGERL